MEPSASASRIPLPSATDDLIAIAVYAVCGAVLLGLILITAFVVALLRRRPITRSRQVRGQMEVEETRIMQEIYRSLGKMENRIEALETLLLERPRTGVYSEPAGCGMRRP
jgi:phage shock protein B